MFWSYNGWHLGEKRGQVDAVAAVHARALMPDGPAPPIATNLLTCWTLSDVGRSLWHSTPERSGWRDLDSAAAGYQTAREPRVTTYLPETMRP